MTGAELFAAFERLDRALVAKGFPATSRWWRRVIRRFLESGRRQLVLRVGRRGGKSSTLCRLAVCLALYGEHVIPPGDLGVAAFVSTSRGESGERLRTIEAILEAIGVEHRRASDGGGTAYLEVVGRRLAFKTYVATIAGVSGFTAVVVIGDEVAKWRDADSGANPATEVLASVRPTMATQPNARIVLSSSPLSTLDAHYDAFEAGDDDFQIVAQAPTWEANPTVTEADTHTLEKDPRVRAREYGAIPQAAAQGAFSTEEVYPAWIFPVLRDLQTPVVVLDASGGGGDAFVYAVVRWAKRVDCTPVLAITDVGAFKGAFGPHLTAESIVAHIARTAKAAGTTDAIGDQYSAFAMQSLFSAKGIRLRQLSWTGENKIVAVQRVRTLLRDRRIVVTPGAEGETMRRQMLALEERITPSGHTTFAGRRGTHDDHAMTLLLAGLADVHGMLRGSAMNPGSTFAFSDNVPSLPARGCLLDGPGTHTFRDFMESPSARERRTGRR